MSLTERLWTLHPLGHSTSFWIMFAQHWILLLGGLAVGFGVGWWTCKRRADDAYVRKMNALGKLYAEKLR